MIKSEIRSLIINYLRRFSEIEKYHPRFIDAAIEEVIKQKLWELHSVDPLSIQRFVKKYGYTTPITVSYEASTHLYYSTLPAAIVPFRDKASGVRRISTPIQGSVLFHPMDSRELDLVMNGAYVDSVTSTVGYCVTDRIDYYNIPAGIITSGVRLDMIVPFSVYTDSETVVLPEFRDEQGETFVDRVIKRLGEIPDSELNENKQLEESK